MEHERNTLGPLPDGTMIRAQIGDAMTLRPDLVIQWALTHYGQEAFVAAVAEAMFREWPACQDPEGKLGPDILVVFPYPSDARWPVSEYRLQAIRDTEPERVERARQQVETDERNHWLWARKIGTTAIGDGLADGKGKVRADGDQGSS